MIRADSHVLTRHNLSLTYLAQRIAKAVLIHCAGRSAVRRRRGGDERQSGLLDGH